MLLITGAVADVFVEESVQRLLALIGLELPDILQRFEYVSSPA